MAKTTTTTTTTGAALRNALAPEALAFQSRHIEVGPRWARAYAAVAFPPAVEAGWLQAAAQLPGVTLSVHAVPQAAMDLVQAINRRVGQVSGQLAAGRLQPLTAQRLEAELRDLQQLLRQIDLEQVAVVNVGIVLLVQAPDAETGERRARRVEGVLAAQGVRVRPLAFRQEEGLQAAGPWGWWPESLRGDHLWPVSTVAAAWPFGGASINHGAGIVLGHDSDGGLVLVNRWDPPADSGISNRNQVILAASGAGKSYATKVALLREWAQGARVIILDPEREYRALARAVGGTWINAAGGGTRINPLQAPPVPDIDQEADGAAEQPLLRHWQRVRLFLSLYLPGLTAEQQARLSQGLRAIYAARGLTPETDPATVPPDGWPHLGDLWAWCHAQADPEAQRLAALLDDAAHGADAALWAGPSTVSVQDADWVVLDLHDLQDAAASVQRAQYQNVLAFAWDLVRQSRQERVVLVADEAWMLIDPRTPEALAFLRSMAKRVRKYHGSLWVVTQNAIDFLAAEVRREGEPVLANASFALLMRQEGRDLPTVADLYALSDAERDRLASARVGEGLLIAGNQRAWVTVATAPHEARLLQGV